MEYDVQGLNYRMSNLRRPWVSVQAERMQAITDWKNEVAEKHLNPLYSKRLVLPKGMISGLYKYIIFEPVEKSTGKVYDKLCHTILKQDGSFQTRNG